MSAVNINLGRAESVAVEHLAEALGVSTEDIAYAALHELMRRADEPHVQHEIVELRATRHQSRPPWTAGSGSLPTLIDDEDEVNSLSRFF